jgi:hypothetical protein
VAHDELWKDAIGSARGDKILDNPKVRHDNQRPDQMQCQEGGAC